MFFIGFCFIQGSFLYWVLFYTGLCFLLGSVLYRIMFFIGFCFILGSVLYRVLYFIGLCFMQGYVLYSLITGFCFIQILFFIQDYVFYWVPFDAGCGLDSFHCTVSNIVFAISEKNVIRCDHCEKIRKQNNLKVFGSK